MRDQYELKPAGWIRGLSRQAGPDAPVAFIIGSHDSRPSTGTCGTAQRSGFRSPSTSSESAWRPNSVPGSLAQCAGQEFESPLRLQFSSRSGRFDLTRVSVQWPLQFDFPLCHAQADAGRQGQTEVLRDKPIPMDQRCPYFRPVPGRSGWCRRRRGNRLCRGSDPGHRRRPRCTGRNTQCEPCRRRPIATAGVSEREGSSP
jgi:hypothetical protein